MHAKFRQFISEQMTVDDMPNQEFQIIAQHLGIEASVQILELMAGMWMSVPKTWNMKIAERYVRENYDGGNVRQLVLETGLSMTTIYKLLNEKANTANQSTLFDAIDGEKGNDD